MKLFETKTRRDAQEAQKGFTLIELSIVLVIIGLLVGGVIKGQELIKGARQNNLSNAVQGYIAAANNYMGTYRAMPGDDAAATRWAGITASLSGDGNGVIGGNFNDTTGSEARYFWLHLRNAGLITGATTDQTQPTNPFGGIFGVEDTAMGFTGTVLCSSAVPGDIALRMDIKEDDGIPGSGDIRSNTNLNKGQLATTATYDPDADYTMCWRL